MYNVPVYSKQTAEGKAKEHELALMPSLRVNTAGGYFVYTSADGAVVAVFTQAVEPAR